MLGDPGLSAGLLGRDDTLYLQFSRYPGHASMAGFAGQVRDLIDRAGIRQLIIDMRGNTGGDFFVGLRLAQALIEADGIDWKAGVYLLTDHGSYSAAVSNAVQFSQMLGARRVGEPTGAGRRATRILASSLCRIPVWWSAIPSACSPSTHTALPRSCQMSWWSPASTITAADAIRWSSGC